MSIDELTPHSALLRIGDKFELDGRYVPQRALTHGTVVTDVGVFDAHANLRLPSFDLRKRNHSELRELA
jgi:hypothetical protein